MLKTGDLIPTGTYRDGKADKPEFMLMRDLDMELYAQGSGLKAFVPVGYITDRYSIPSVLAGWQATEPKYLTPALIHDWLYDVGLVDRSHADLVFRLLMKTLDIPWKNWLLSWAAVRAGGWRGFKKPDVANLELVEKARNAKLLGQSAKDRKAYAVRRLNKRRRLAGLPLYTGEDNG